MATFRFEIGGILSCGKTTGDSSGNFTSIASCPFCHTKYTSRKNKEDSRTIENMEGSVRNMLRKHCKRKHGK